MLKLFILILWVLLPLSYFGQALNNISTTRIAVMNFNILCTDKDYSSYSYLSTGFAETLTDAFSRLAQFRTVERAQLAKILGEQNFQASGKVDSTNAVKIGKLLGVDKLLLGSCQITTGHLLVNMRIVNSETGQTFPIDGLPIIMPIDSALYVQAKLCNFVLKQFNFPFKGSDTKEIKMVTSNSTKSIKAYEFLNRGVEYYENKQFEEAISMFDFALQYDKKYGKAYYKRGLTNYALSQYEKAAQDYGNITNYLKKDTVYQLMGDAYYKQGDYKKALECLKKAEKLNPNKLSIKYSLMKFDTIVDQSRSTLKSDTNKIEFVYEFIDGIAKVKVGKKYGFIDLNNNIIVPAVFDEIKLFTFGLAPAKQGSKWGYINSKGLFVIPPIYIRAENFNSDKLAEVSVGLFELFEKVGVIDTSGKIIVPTDFSFIHIYNGQIEVIKYNGMSERESHGIYNYAGEIILPVIYDKIKEFYSYTTKDYIRVCYKGKWGVVNFKNEILLPFKYKDENCISDKSNGYYGVNVNGKWGFVDYRGLEVIDPVYERVGNYNNIGFPVKNRGKWGVIDLKSNFIIPMIYDKLEYIKNGYWAAKKNGSWGVINSKNETTCGFVYEKMASELQEYNLISHGTDKFKIEVMKTGKRFWINETCKCVMDCK